MKNQLDAVERFHEAFSQEFAQYPFMLDEDKFMLRHRLMAEENDEYLEACENNDIVGIADALGDQLYILCGTILKHGLQNVIEDIFDEIQASNMSKLGEDGRPILREDGKILKGSNYRKPDIQKFL
jgi:predicted HAD superfamily Cof-like phosphohydrolase